jgi:hypothetical protein
MSFKGLLNKGRVPVKIWSDLATVESAALKKRFIPVLTEQGVKCLGARLSVSFQLMISSHRPPELNVEKTRELWMRFQGHTRIYKDIDEVMENQKDLVKVVAQLRQIMCIKG